ncbi:hypothetical protein HSBAA_41600 [Vreelandella sulfidaeris]|uniref:Glutaredoxin 4 n=1 Tax=Vreelandella sulfidaeris TaxID=115553 RepID=A0A455UIS5_9GAMM|nr:hypothetical protein HSBAA_41600 [Halomonas sulfidaeris]
MSTTAENIQRQISENPVLIYMKGSPQLPQCGFSAQTVQALMSCGERFAFVNVLDNPDIRAELPKIANWPTFPQLWVEGELVGGCDIVVEMHQSGELEKLVKRLLSAPALRKVVITPSGCQTLRPRRLAGCGAAARMTLVHALFCYASWHLLRAA